MALNGTNIQVDGRGLNPNAVATFVENIKGDEMFDEPEVSQITHELAQLANQNQITVYKYGMSFNFTYTAPGSEAAAPAPGAAPAAGAGTPGQ